MKKTILALICLTAMVTLIFSAGCVSTENIGLQSNDDALQKELQDYVTAHYGTYKTDLINLLKKEETKLSINDFCNELYFSEPEWDRYTQSYHVMLYSKTGFYIGPVVFLDDQGNKVDKIESAALTPTLGIRYGTEYLNYTIVTLDEINPEFQNFDRFDIK